MKLILTVDTEADSQWDTGAKLTTANLDYVPRFQELCEQFEFPPTYLCTHEVITSPVFDRTLAKPTRSGYAEVGTHLHPWSTPPFDSTWDDAERAHPYPSELPTELLQSKLQTLTETLGDRLGEAPTSYRAGRWGFSTTQVSLLESLGYLVDCSVTPFVSWARHRGLQMGGPDFTNAPIFPYSLSKHDMCCAGSSGLLEVPVTIVHANQMMRRSALLRRWFRHYASWSARAGDRFFRLAPQWFRPFPHMSAERLIAVYETASALGMPAVEMMLHSSELMPGGSPDNPTPAAVNNLFHQLKRTFSHLTDRGVEGVTLTAFAQSYLSTNPEQVRRNNESEIP